MRNDTYTPATGRVDMTAPDAIDQILSIHRDLFGGWCMEDGDENHGEDQGQDSSAPPDEPTANGSEDPGFPAETPLKEMTPEQQAAYWKQKSRGWEAKAKSREDYEQVKTERDQLRRSGMTADEKAIEDAKTAARDEGRLEERTRLSRAIVTGQLRGLLEGKGVAPDRVDAAIGPINHTYFLTESGEVDTDKVRKYAGGFVGTQRPDTGQGRRGSATGGKESGADLYERHYGKKK